MLLAGAAHLKSQQPIINRLQAAAQRLSHMGRPTTVGKAFAATAGKGIGRRTGGVGASWDGWQGQSSGGAVDNAAISALRSAAGVDMLAPTSCPAALIKTIVGEQIVCLCPPVLIRTC